MPYKQIKIETLIICAGDLRHRANLLTRSIDEPTGQLIDYSMEFGTVAQVWAAIKTVNGIDIFDGTNVIATASHLIYIRYRADITSENFVEINSKYFRILQTENLNEDNKWLLLKCSERGTTSNEANWS